MRLPGVIQQLLPEKGRSSIPTTLYGEVKIKSPGMIEWMTG